MVSSERKSEHGSPTQISPVLTLWLSLMVEPGLFGVWIVLLTIQFVDSGWLFPFLIGDGKPWAGVLPTSLGWSFLVKIGTYAILSLIWLNEDRALQRTWRRLTVLLVGLSTFQGLAKILLTLPLISKYQQGIDSVPAIELQYARIPWSGLGTMLEFIVLALCMFCVFESVRQLRRNEKSEH